MSTADFQPLIDWLSLHPGWLLFSVALISFIESLALAGIVVPGVLLLFMAAAAAGNLGMDLWSVLFAGFMGAVAGDGISFFIGYRYKETLRQYWPFSRYPKALQAGEDFFARHGGKSVIVGRFVGPIRPVLPLVAGMVGMSPRRFICFNLASALAWSPFYILPGYAAGAAVHLALPQHLYLVVALLIMTLLLAVLGFRYLSVNLQVGSRWYDVVNLELENSRVWRRLWCLVGGAQDASTQTELPLPSLVLAVTGATFFLLWSLLVLNGGVLQTVDQFFLEFAASARSARIDQVLISLTLLGDELFLYYSFALLILIMLLQGRRIAALHLICAGLSTAAITHLCKFGFAVSRPELVLSPPVSFAYPSGHSSGAALFYGLLASFIAQEMAHPQRWRVYVLFGIPIVFIALSRVLLGVHWFSDVLGGLALGLASCGVTRVVYSRYRLREGSMTTRYQWSSYLGLVLWLCAVGGYQYVYFAEAIDRFQLRTP